MPRPKLPDSTVDKVVELLLCGWTPQQVVDCWTASDPTELRNPSASSWDQDDLNCLHDTGSCPSLGAIQRLAKEHGLARRQGGARIGAGKPKGGRGGGGRPGGPGRKFSRHREEVRRLRSEGHSLRVIAGLVGLRSPQQVSNLITDEE